MKKVDISDTLRRARRYAKLQEVVEFDIQRVIKSLQEFPEVRALRQSIEALKKFQQGKI